MHRIALRNSARKVALAAAPRVRSQSFSLFFARLNFFLSQQNSALSSRTYATAKPGLYFLPPTSTVCLHVPIIRLVLHSICRSAAASEVSSILESRISGTSVGGNVEETGRVLSMLPSSTSQWLSSELFFQASVTVSDVFGVSRTCKVQCFSFVSNMK